MSDAVVVHYLAQCDGGPIKTTHKAVSLEGQTTVLCSGGEHAVACQPKRMYLAKGVGSGRNFRLTEWFSATGQMFDLSKTPSGQEVVRELVTCPRCKAAPLYLRDKKSFDETRASKETKGV